MPAFTGSADFQEDAHGNTVEEGEAEACTEVHRRTVRSRSRGLPVENVVQGLSAELGEEIPPLRGEGKVKGALFHSDQGWQYQRKEFGDILKGYGRIQTMSRKGNCHDNSVMENFFGGSRPRCSTDRKTDTGTTAALRRQSWSTSTGTTQVG